MIYLVLSKYEKFLFCVYPFIYYCQPNMRSNIHTQLSILGTNIGIKNIMWYIEKRYPQLKFDMIKSMSQVITLGSIIYYMNNVEKDKSTLINKLSLLLCNCVQNVSIFGLVISIWKDSSSHLINILLGTIINNVIETPSLRSFLNNLTTGISEVREYVRTESLREPSIVSTLSTHLTSNRTRSRLTQEQLLSIAPPKFKGNDDRVLTDVTCSVCLEQVTENGIYRQLPCTHYFHPHCIDKWLLECSVRCPLCNVNLISTTDIMASINENIRYQFNS